MWRLPGDDYPSGLMAMRLRLRRMLCFLKRHGLISVARELEKATGVFFDASYMEHLLRMGSWDKADDYLLHFLPTAQHQSDQSSRLIIHLRSAWTMAAVAAGGREAAGFATVFDDNRNPHFAKFQKLLHKMHADQPRASSLWKEVAPNAVNSAMDLVADCPELKGKQKPLPRSKPWEVAPLIGARGSRRRRSSKAGGRTPAHVLSRAYMQRKRLHSIQEKDACSEQQAMDNVEAVLEKMDTSQL